MRICKMLSRSMFRLFYGRHFTSKIAYRWEKEGKHSRAACWLVFTRQYSKAVELLMRSKGKLCSLQSYVDPILTYYCR